MLIFARTLQKIETRMNTWAKQNWVEQLALLFSHEVEIDIKRCQDEISDCYQRLMVDLCCNCYNLSYLI
jgi:hypothetical protein